jgi:hypothetical protein
VTDRGGAVQRDEAYTDEQGQTEQPVRAGTRFRCEVCATEIIVVKAPAGPVSCCGREMERMR